MARNRFTHGHARASIAYLAAKLIAEDGITDFALAKRKAATQAGFTYERDGLPSNEEVEQALGDYLQLYKLKEHEERITHLRRCALRMMKHLERFNPRLSGSVLDGNSGRYSSIEISLFVDNVKEVEMFLLDSGLDFEPGARKIFRDNIEQTVAVFHVTTEDADYDITTFAHSDHRHGIRTNASGRPLRHAKIKEVAAILEEKAFASGD